MPINGIYPQHLESSVIVVHRNAVPWPCVPHLKPNKQSGSGHIDLLQYPSSMFVAYKRRHVCYPKMPFVMYSEADLLSRQYGVRVYP